MLVQLREELKGLQVAEASQKPKRLGTAARPLEASDDARYFPLPKRWFTLHAAMAVSIEGH